MDLACMTYESQLALNEMKKSLINQLHLDKIPKGMRTEFHHDLKAILKNSNWNFLTK